MILGIPKQKISDVKKEIKHLLDLDINHISAYGLIVEENTKLAQNLANKKYKLPSEKKSLKMYDTVLKMLAKQNIFRYEVSNFAKEGCECRHNLKYWTDKEYLGLGVVSSSYVDGIRWKNTDDLKKYCEYYEDLHLEEFELNYFVSGIGENVEMLTDEDRIEECVMLALRTSQGIDLKEFENKFGFDLIVKKNLQIAELVENNMICLKDDRLFCTNKGFELLNQIILMLI